jgi:hypothetical protein
MSNTADETRKQKSKKSWEPKLETDLILPNTKRSYNALPALHLSFNVSTDTVKHKNPQIAHPPPSGC